MNLKNIEWQNVNLLLETVRSGHMKEPVPNLIKVGRQPVVIDAIKFYQKENRREPIMEMLVGESDFYYVGVPLSFRPVESMQIKLVSVELDLHEPGNQAEAWSMEPTKMEQEIRVGLEAKISSGLKLAPAELSSSIGSSQEYIVYQPVIEAFNLGRRDPAWEFRPSEGRRLSGIQILHLIIRQPKGTTSKCKVNINGDIEDKTGIFRFFGRIKKESEDPITFDCPN